MDKSPVSESHHLVQGSDLVFSDLVLKKILPYFRIGLRYSVEMQHYVYSFMFNG